MGAVVEIFLFPIFYWAWHIVHWVSSGGFKAYSPPNCTPLAVKRQFWEEEKIAWTEQLTSSQKQICASRQVRSVWKSLGWVTFGSRKFGPKILAIHFRKIHFWEIHFRKTGFWKIHFWKYTFGKKTLSEKPFSENTISENTLSEHTLSENTLS